MKLWNLAHTRTGDKGDTSNISVIAYKAADYAKLCEALTAACVERYMERLFAGHALPKNFAVRRYELPGVQGLNFVITGVLHGGVTRSLALDAHGKTLGSILLDLDV
ncbi:MAG TPA: hypothetical protein VF271_05090 [Rhodanobacteraceae bacterium]